MISAFIGGPLIDASAGGSTGHGPRLAFLLAPVWLAIGALLLRPVVERRREDEPSSSAGRADLA